MWLFVAFVMVPLIEIALFIQVGGLIGLWPTLAIVLFTAILGSYLVRNQGLMAIGKLQRSFERLNDPTEPLAHGAMILISGALLLTPGFFTDAMGFALLMPPVRAGVIRYLRARVKVQSFSMGDRGSNRQGHHQRGRDDVIDGEFTEVDPERKSMQGPSGWTKH